jgi:hypothetical protein
MYLRVGSMDMTEYSSTTVTRILNLNTFQSNHEMSYENNSISPIFSRHPIAGPMIDTF